MLAEYGAFEILGYRTFTTEIFTEFHVFDLPGACALSLVLVVLSIVAVGGRAAGPLARPGGAHRDSRHSGSAGGTTSVEPNSRCCWFRSP